jgi:chemotaxis protein methyltransferase CheR
MDSFSRYCTYLFSAEGQAQETIRMIDLVTTNKTDFFREADHFSYLVDTLLPLWEQKHGGGTRRCFYAWSAGCSTGEEPYTLAMVLQNYAERSPGFTFRILATDISTRVLETARLAVYSEERICTVPEHFKKKYFLRSKERNEGLVRIVPELRSTVQFTRLNFMEEFAVQGEFDIIFCRNVIIYFDRPTQEMLLGRLREQLCDDGHLFLGHSETLSGHNLPLTAVHPTVYRNCA